MTKAHITGINTLALTVTGLSSSNYSYSSTFEGKTGTYCVANCVDTFIGADSGSQRITDRVQFMFYGANFTELDALVCAFRSKFDYTLNLSITGYTVERVEPISEVPPIIDGDIWTHILFYEIITLKNR